MRHRKHWDFWRRKCKTHTRTLSTVKIARGAKAFQPTETNHKLSSIDSCVKSSRHASLTKSTCMLVTNSFDCTQMLDGVSKLLEKRTGTRNECSILAHLCELDSNKRRKAREDMVHFLMLLGDIAELYRTQGSWDIAALLRYRQLEAIAQFRLLVLLATTSSVCFDQAP